MRRLLCTLTLAALATTNAQAFSKKTPELVVLAQKQEEPQFLCAVAKVDTVAKQLVQVAGVPCSAASRFFKAPRVKASDMFRQPLDIRTDFEKGKKN